MPEGKKILEDANREDMERTPRMPPMTGYEEASKMVEPAPLVPIIGTPNGRG